MLIVLAVIGLGLIVLVLLDAFETVVLPRRIVRPLRLSRLFYWPVQRLWAAIGRRLRNPENFLSFFGPLSLIMLLSFWAVALIIGFALLHNAAPELMYH